MHDGPCIWCPGHQSSGGLLWCPGFGDASLPSSRDPLGEARARRTCCVVRRLGFRDARSTVGGDSTPSVFCRARLHTPVDLAHIHRRESHFLKLPRSKELSFDPLFCNPCKIRCKEEDRRLSYIPIATMPCQYPLAGRPVENLKNKETRQGLVFLRIGAGAPGQP